MPLSPTSTGEGTGPESKGQCQPPRVGVPDEDLDRAVDLFDTYFNPIDPNCASNKVLASCLRKQDWELVMVAHTSESDYLRVCRRPARDPALAARGVFEYLSVGSCPAEVTLYFDVMLDIAYWKSWDKNCAALETLPSETRWAVDVDVVHTALFTTPQQ